MHQNEQTACTLLHIAHLISVKLEPLLLPYRKLFLSEGCVGRTH